MNVTNWVSNWTQTTKQTAIGVEKSDGSGGQHEAGQRDSSPSAALTTSAAVMTVRSWLNQFWVTLWYNLPYCCPLWSTLWLTAQQEEHSIVCWDFTTKPWLELCVMWCFLITADKVRHVILTDWYKMTHSLYLKKKKKKKGRIITSSEPNLIWLKKFRVQRSPI